MNKQKFDYLCAVPSVDYLSFSFVYIVLKIYLFSVFTEIFFEFSRDWWLWWNAFKVLIWNVLFLYFKFKIKNFSIKSKKWAWQIIKYLDFTCVQKLIKIQFSHHQIKMKVLKMSQDFFMWLGINPIEDQTSHRQQMLYNLYGSLAVTILGSMIVTSLVCAFNYGTAQLNDALYASFPGIAAIRVFTALVSMIIFRREITTLFINLQTFNDQSNLKSLFYWKPLLILLGTIIKKIRFLIFRRISRKCSYLWKGQ